MLSEMGSEGGAYLADLRLKRGLALDQVVNALAARYQIRISRSALSRYETGARTHPDAILLWGLSHVYAEPLEKMITASRNRSDLSRHTASTDSADADVASSRQLALAALQDAARAIANAAAALSGETPTARASAPTRHRIHRKAG